jgi:hypothetical protein
MRYVVLATVLVSGCAWTNTGGCGLGGCAPPSAEEVARRDLEARQRARAKQCVLAMMDPAVGLEEQARCRSFLEERDREQRRDALLAQERQRRSAAESRASAQRVANVFGALAESMHENNRQMEESDRERRAQCEAQPKRFESRCHPDGLGLGGMKCETVQVWPRCY